MACVWVGGECQFAPGGTLAFVICGLFVLHIYTYIQIPAHTHTHTYRHTTSNNGGLAKNTGGTSSSVFFVFILFFFCFFLKICPPLWREHSSRPHGRPEQDTQTYLLCLGQVWFPLTHWTLSAENNDKTTSVWGKKKKHTHTRKQCPEQTWSKTCLTTALLVTDDPNSGAKGHQGRTFQTHLRADFDLFGKKKEKRRKKRKET